ncbi:MAG: VOC family protein [Pseudomonadota bacterium]
MATLTSIHHINFIVNDLQKSVADYQRELGLGDFEFEELTNRGVNTARILIGSVWLVLVCPLRRDSVPGQYLQKHGEGFFLLSFGVDDLHIALAEFEQRGMLSDSGTVRSGLANWKVADLDTLNTLGAIFHLTEEQDKE